MGLPCIRPELVGVELLKSEVLLNKPVFIGQAVLDLSKLVIYKLRYEQLAKYARQFQGDICIAAGDTHSFFLEVKYSMIGVHLGGESSNVCACLTSGARNIHVASTSPCDG